MNSLNRTRFIVLLLTFVSVACQRESVNKHEDNRVIIHADSIWYPDGSLVSGDLYFDAPSEKRIRWPYYLVLGSLAGATAILAWFFARRSRRVRDLQKTVERDRAEIFRLEEYLSSMPYPGTEAAIALVHDRVNMVKAFLEKHDSLQKREGLSYMDELESLQETVQNYRQFLDELRGDTAFVGNLETALDAGKDEIIRKARNVLSNLTETDAQILVCVYAGMPPSSISFVTGLKPGTVRTRKSRLRDRIEALPESEERQLLLREWL
jgi:DNA-directed RNA polymerase specialized sigma24 family protein